MQRKELKIKISYEPNRLTEIFVADAYEKVMPTIKQVTNVIKKDKGSLKPTMLQTIGGN